MQNACIVATPLVQLAGVHCVLAPGRKQLVRSVPLQVPLQALPSLAHAGRLPRGAPVTAVHVPGVRSHASHWPVQALLQHTPSAQAPLVH